MIAPDGKSEQNLRVEQASLIHHSVAREAFANTPEGCDIYPVYGTDSNGNCKCRKGSGCESPGKHPATRNGVHDASSDPHEINKLFANKPGCNVGLATGRESGVVIFDVDPRNGGTESLMKLLAEHGELLVTRIHSSGGGGFHIFFAYPTELPRLGSRLLAPGVELKADGAGVVLPPSVHVSGGLYEVINNAPLAPLPGWIYERQTKLELIEGESNGDQSPGESRFVLPDMIVEGSRNSTLFRYSCSLRAHGWSYTDIIGELQRVNSERCNPQTSNAELRKIARSASKYPPGKAFKVSPEVLGRIVYLEESYPRSKRGTADHSDWAMFYAVAGLSRLFGRLYQGSDVSVQASVRQLALWSGLSLKTASVSLKRLEKRVYRVWRGSGGKPGIIALRVPETDSSTTFRPPPQRVDTVVDASVVKELRGLRHGARGIGKIAGATMLEILEAPGIHRTELAKKLGKKPDSMSRTLKRLVDFGLAERFGRGRYRASPNWMKVFDRERMKTGEKLIEERDRNLYEQQRLAFRFQLAEREAHSITKTKRSDG